VSYRLGRAEVQRCDDAFVNALIEHHRRVCSGFGLIVHAVPEGSWSALTPCTEWTARDVVEHVIGFHDFLLLRPLGVRAHRPREGPAARWDATSVALFTALDADGVLDRATELPGGGTSTPRTMIQALTTDVLVHTWDLARAAGLPSDLDDELCVRAYEAAHASEFRRADGMIGEEIPVAAGASATDNLVAFYGRDPAWAP
jgi:uncharacterized protein (TIGR03086 family)